MSDFKVGDYVETVTGRVGYITKICDCSMCKERGFNEPIVQYKDHLYLEYITIADKDNSFKNYIRIGKYTFNNEGKEEVEPNGIGR